MTDAPQTQRSPVLAHLRAVGAALAVACAAAGLYEFQVSGRDSNGWWLLLAALLLGGAAQAGLRYAVPEPAPPPLPASTARRVLGALVALAGAALWVIATRRIYRNWAEGFDFAGRDGPPRSS